MLNQHREYFNKISIKIGMLFSKVGLTPNHWTLLSILPAIFSAYFLPQFNFPLAAIFFGVAALLDFIDGSVARVTGRVTKFGAYLDTIVDRYIELIIIVGLFFVPLPDVFLPHRFWLILFVFGGTMTTYVKAAAKEKDLVTTELKGGTFERAERLIILFFAIFAAYFNTMFLSAAIVALAIGSNITAFERIWKAKKANEKKT